MLGSASSALGICEIIERELYRRPPEAIWLRDVPWFVDAWGVRSTGRLERSLSEVAAGRDLAFVSWLEGHPGGLVGRPGERGTTANSRATPTREQ